MIRETLRILRVVGQRTAGFLAGLGAARIAVGLGGFVIILLVFFMLFTAGWDRPPMKSVQTGYRGGGQSLVYNPRKVSDQMAATDFQNAPPKASSGGPRAGAVFENVQVLRNLSVGQFLRQMQGMANAVAPDQGCSYCHANGNYASDKLYTKRVARRMLQMTREINTKWAAHVDGVGVTCYTCHRGNNVPENVWANKVAGVTQEGSGKLPPSKENGYASLPSDLYHAYLQMDKSINVQSNYAMPNGAKSDIQDTEGVFGLMIHMSNALGVNCSFCHNSRAFSSWEGQGRPHKIRAWYGIHMLRELNETYMDSLADTFPPSQKGPDGKPFGINCETCHQGVYKPLYGQKVIADYPALAVPDNSGGNGKPIPASAPRPGSDKTEHPATPGNRPMPTMPRSASTEGSSPANGAQGG
ncbi:photosynthetic reaction center cytochrome PufC [Salinisphaera sp. Q1T1-3]|uniref:photosynthetic reaction center cytochrome PufC n=1 Tax=Salinisphaera sp. Q1T1-3 TaxID=2321229 RepID=UPI000E7548B7|nr:photosynthetic reaction center cytochrome PufC [Salinisphaera sp. Q1T1-3]RJS92090.1 photosynthetic reaction center cytochrome c subunit [Salinisphaera sp. Q1T1-3]